MKSEIIYVLRSAIVNAIGCNLLREEDEEKTEEQDQEDSKPAAKDEEFTRCNRQSCCTQEAGSEWTFT